MFNRYPYAAFHWIIHLISALAVAYFFANQISGYLAAVLANIVIDSDHLPLVFKTGIRGYLRLRLVTEFSRPRKYPMHNLPAIVATFTVGTWQLLLGNSFYATAILAVALHLLWDFAEDAVLFKIGIKHWL